MLSGGRVHLGGGNALQKKFDIEDSPDQIFADWINPQARRQPLQRPRSGAHVRRRMRADLPVPARQRRHLHREADRHAGRLDRAAGVRHPRMAHPERGDRAAAQPQRLGAGAPPRRKRAQEGRADPAQARDDARSCATEAKAACAASSRRPTAATSPSRPRRASSSPPAATPATSTSAACSIRGSPRNTSRPACPTRSRAPTASSPRWTSARRCGRPAPRPARSAPPSPRRAMSERRWGYLSLYFETDSPIFHLCKATGLTVTDWQEAILVNQSGKRFWNELDSSYDFINAALGNHGDNDQAQRRRSDLGDLRRRRGGAAEVEARSRRMSIPTAISPAPTRSSSWPAGSGILTRSSRSPARCCKRR